MNKLGRYLSRYYRTVLQLSAIFIISCAVGDDSPPAQIEDFTISSNNKMFTWTAPGDDGTSGKATLYLLRFFTEEQVAEILGTDSLDGLPESQVHEAVQNNFDSATHLPRFLVPKNAGESELTAIPRLEISGTKKYFYSIVANDETGASSSPSNVLEVTSELVNANFTGESQGCLGSSASSGEFIHEAGEDNLGDITRDIIIGDPCLGKVYIFIGGGNITRNMENIDVASADVTITGNPQDEFGHSVSAVGNVSGSSLYEEFAIGAPGALNDTGQVFILQGNRNLPSTIDLRTNPDESALIITGESSGDRFGFKIARRGFNNFFVSAPSALSETGKVYSFISSNLQDQASPEADEIITGREQGEQFGYSIADGGNINSSSPNEFIVGAPGGGRAYVFFNTGTFNLANLPEESTGDVMTISGRPEDRFGEAVGGGFDFDGIGQSADVVISAPSAGNGKGSVFIYTDEVINEAAANNSREIAFTEFTLKIDGENDGDRLGAGLAVVPDINPTLGIDQRRTANVLTRTQGNADVAIGAPGFNAGAGKAYVIFGGGIDDTETGSTFPVTELADHIISPADTVTSFGSNLNNVFDINGDNFLDVTIGGNNKLTLSY